jgi:hypothetical protein
VLVVLGVLPPSNPWEKYYLYMTVKAKTNNHITITTTSCSFPSEQNSSTKGYKQFTSRIRVSLNIKIKLKLRQKKAKIRRYTLHSRIVLYFKGKLGEAPLTPHSSPSIYLSRGISIRSKQGLYKSLSAHLLSTLNFLQKERYDDYSESLKEEWMSACE